jgi:hypothetical protein
MGRANSDAPVNATLTLNQLEVEQQRSLHE